jgi:hypothetical protein
MAWEHVQGDKADTLYLQCVVNGVVEDITDASGAALVWLDPDGNRIEKTLTLTVPDQGIVQYDWQDGDPADVGGLVGIHQFKVRVTRGSGDMQTFPSDDSFFRVRVTAKP